PSSHLSIVILLIACSGHHRDLHSFPTRRSSDLQNRVTFDYLGKIPERQSIKNRLTELWNYERFGTPFKRGSRYFISKNDGLQNQDRKSTRLNSSHVKISYAVFCLKKKNKIKNYN